MGHRVQMLRLLALTEAHIGSRRIDEFFDEAVFPDPFFMHVAHHLCLQKWHSAIELRRYFLRFVQEFSHPHLAGVKRTRHNQYDSMVVLLQRWLIEQGVDALWPPRDRRHFLPPRATAHAAPRRCRCKRCRWVAVDTTLDLGQTTSPSLPWAPSPRTRATAATTTFLPGAWPRDTMAGRCGKDRAEGP